MTRYTILEDRLENFVKWYARALRRGRVAPFHAVLGDFPYHLHSIVRRFGGPNAAPPRYGTDGLFARQSRGFMGKTWDGGDLAFQSRTWALLARICHPGAFIFCYASGRGEHRVAYAMEEAGLLLHHKIYNYRTGAATEVPPRLGWVQGQGNPKGTRIDTQLDRRAGATRPTVRIKYYGNELMRFNGQNTRPWTDKAREVGYHEMEDPDSPQTEAARRWHGYRYGQQSLAPRIEPIVVAQVPYEASAVVDIDRTGAGALWIDGARISLGEGEAGAASTAANRRGRYPSNFALTHHPECKTGGIKLVRNRSNSVTGDEPSKKTKHTYKNGYESRPFQKYGGGDGYEAVTAWSCHPDCPVPAFDDQAGDAKSRYYFQAGWMIEVAEAIVAARPARYQPKVSTLERNAGLEHREDVLRHRVNPGGMERDPKWAPVPAKNDHPTLKPIALNQWLATLLLPPAHYAPRRILIPCAGTMSEAIGALLAGWDEIVAVEMEPSYAAIGRDRMEWWADQIGYGCVDPEAILRNQASVEDDYQQLE